MTGCAHCWSERGAQGELEPVAGVVNEPHFDVVVRRCPKCAQHFASVCCERVSFSGDDDLYIHTIPLSADEAAQLQGAADAERFLHELAPRVHAVSAGGAHRVVDSAVRLPSHH